MKKMTDQINPWSAIREVYFLQAFLFPVTMARRFLSLRTSKMVYGHAG
jgi:hypothetical protein